jgi:glycerate kinase
MMKVVVAIDSFKGSVSSMQAGEAVRLGILSACPDAEVWILPLADGGEGTMDALSLGLGGEKISMLVTGPLGEKVSASYVTVPKQ